jgi:nucleoside-diphosphate-sugar epimerase
VINIGHPDVVPIEALAERVRAELGAPHRLVRVVEQPSRMTLVKRPSLERQRTLLGVEPAVSLDEGVTLVCRRVRERLALGESL